MKTRIHNSKPRKATYLRWGLMAGEQIMAPGDYLQVTRGVYAEILPNGLPSVKHAFTKPKTKPAANCKAD